MSKLLYKEGVFKLVGCCMEIHRELGGGQEEIIHQDAMEVELQRTDIPFTREKRFDAAYKGVVLPHHHFADFVIWDKIPFEAKASTKTDRRARQAGDDLPRRLKTRTGIAGQLRRPVARMETVGADPHKTRTPGESHVVSTRILTRIQKLSWSCPQVRVN